jgi:hypothetical protein
MLNQNQTDLGIRNRFNQINDRSRRNQLPIIDNARERIVGMARQIVGWFGRRWEDFSHEFAKAAGHEAGKWTTRSILLILADQLFGLGVAIIQWLRNFW